MPTTVISSEQKPTFIAKPDMRFATTMLSSLYRDYAVDGEQIVDKNTGEIFIKRPIDGRIISFDQNKKYIGDLALQLRVLLTNNEEFVYPTMNEKGFYVNTNYDLVSINDERYVNILEESTIITNSTDTKVHQLKFKVSNDTNGFFCRPTTRDSDKAVVEYLTNEYNNYFINYSGRDSELLSEKEKMNTIQTWKDSNVELTYKLNIKSTYDEKTYTEVSYIRLNEEMCVIFPVDKIDNDFPRGYYSAEVTIESMKYPKINFIMNHKDLFSDLEESLDIFLCPDKSIYVYYLNIISFIDSSIDVDLLGNELLIAMLDIPYIRRYMTKMAKLHSKSTYIHSSSRPNDEDFEANTLWAECVRKISADGVISDMGSETYILGLEEELSNVHTSLYNTTILTDDVNDKSAFYLKPKGGE